MYLVAIIDWYSRKILSWKLSNTLETSFCIEALNEALLIATTEIFNTDQGSQFTSINFIDLLKEKGIKISMDSKGRALDNIIIERFWRSFKYEKLYLNDYNSVKELKSGITEYIEFYNNERPHQSLENDFPANIYKSSGGKYAYRIQSSIGLAA
jgi:putative transposase